MKLCSVTQFAAAVSALGLLASCPVDRNIRGAPQMLAGPTEDHCDLDCDCEHFDYNPLCLRGEQYFNPCFAGCTGQNATSGRYINCNCESRVDNGSEEESVGVPGLCPSTCSYLPVFLTSFFFTMMITFMANMPTLTATLRCVDPSVRSLALGIQWLFIRLLGKQPKMNFY